MSIHVTATVVLYTLSLFSSVRKYRHRHGYGYGYGYGHGHGYGYGYSQVSSSIGAAIVGSGDALSS